MKKNRRIFVTYADAAYAGSKRRILREAESTGEFDSVIGAGPEDVSVEVRSAPAFTKRRGGGLWCWKPDIILRTLESASDGDIVVYADSGCELVPGREWRRYWKLLEAKDMIFQRIYQLNEQWTRRSIIEEFSDLRRDWLRRCQFMATVVLVRKTALAMRFVAEWRRYMIDRPDMVMDVTEAEREAESSALKENRHDQAIMTALAYRYLADPSSRSRIHVQWEHVENISILRSQVIRAMRWRHDIPIPISRRIRECLLRLAKDIIRKPFFAFFHERSLFV